MTAGFGSDLIIVMEQVNPVANSQTPSEYPVAQPPKFNFWLASALIIFIILIGVLGYFLGISRNKINQITSGVAEQKNTTVLPSFPKQAESSSSTLLPDQAGAWKTCVNKELGYSFDCLDVWKTTYLRENGKIYRVENTTDNVPAETRGTFGVLVYDIKELKGQSLKDFASYPQKLGGLESIVVAGEKGYRTHWYGDGALSGDYLSYTFDHSWKRYSIEMESEDGNTGNFDRNGSPISKIFSRMISSFKFTN